MIFASSRAARRGEAVELGNEFIHDPLWLVLILRWNIALHVEVYVKPQGAGLDGEPGECFGGRLANLRGHRSIRSDAVSPASIAALTPISSPRL